MRIMLIVNEFPPEKIAGTAMATQALAEHLSLHGHQVCVLVTTVCPEDKYDDIKEHDYDLRWLKPRPFRGLGYVWRIVQTFKHAKAFQPDIIQGQAVSCGLVAGVLGRLLRIPSICYAQGYDVYQASWWQRKTEIRWGCVLPNLCLAVTQNLKRAIGEIVDVQVDVLPHAFVVPEVMQSRQEVRQEHGLACGVKFVLNVARLESFKGHDVLLKAWKACVQTYPDAQLLVAGTGSMQAALEAQVLELGLQAHVKFLGFLPQRDIHALMQAADLFVLPSREEPFGIVLLEAMAHGLPVVASSVDGIPEVLPDKGDTWQVPPGDHEALVHVMLQALQGGHYPSADNQVYALDFEWAKQVCRFEYIYTCLVKDSYD